MQIEQKAFYFIVLIFFYYIILFINHYVYEKEVDMKFIVVMFYFLKDLQTVSSSRTQKEIISITITGRKSGEKNTIAQFWRLFGDRGFRLGLGLDHTPKSLL